MQELTAAPRDSFTEADVLESLSWVRSTRIRWGCDLLDTATLAPTGIDLDVTDAAVSWQWRAQPRDGESPVPAAVRRRGSLRFRHKPGFNPLAVLYRIWVEMDTPTGDPVRWHLGVFVSVMPPFEYQGHADHNGAVVFRPLDLADRSHIWQSHETEDPVWVEVDTDIIGWIQDDLATRFHEFDTSGVVGDVTPKLAAEDYVFDAGTPWLSIYATLLGAIGNEPLHADADGMPRSRPLEDPELRDAEHLYSYGTTVLAPVSVEAVNPDLPNVLRFVARRLPSLAEEGNGIRTITNDSTGPGSIQQRGRQVLQRVEVDAQTQDELDAQARALAPFYFAGGGLRAVQEVGLNPRHDDSDVVFLEKPALGISGNWLVTGWDIRLGDVDAMRTMQLQLEQLTGAAFVVPPPATFGAFGTSMFGELPFGSGGTV
jgi:hypothetical protein